MRILHVVHTPRYSGDEILVASLAKVHTELGHASRVVSINPSEEDFKSVTAQQQQDGVEWIMPLKNLGRLFRAPFIKKNVSDFCPDITFSHSVIPAAYTRLAGIKNVISVLHSETNYESGRARYFEKLLQYRSAGVISVSELARQNYSKIFTYPKTKYIPNGVSIESIKRSVSERKSARAQLGFFDTDIVVIQIGRIDLIKQQHLSLQAMIPIIKGNGAVHLLLAGLVENKLYLDRLKHIAEDAEITPNVRFLGPRKDVANLLAAADLFLMPSLREAQGIAMIEALAAGLPIVASSIQGFQWVIGYDGVSLLPPENAEQFTSAIRSVLAQPRRYDRDLHDLDIKDTALAYIDFATQCTY